MKVSRSLKSESSGLQSSVSVYDILAIRVIFILNGAVDVMVAPLGAHGKWYFSALRTYTWTC